MFKKTILAGLLVCGIACSKQKDSYHTPTFSDNGLLNSVIEIPAGTNKKIEYNPVTASFEIDQRNGKDRIINFLPYPGNYGFIPSTKAAIDQGGDGDALDVLIIAESLPTGTILEIIPIGMLQLLDNGELDYKIIAVPAQEQLRIINVTTYAALIEKHNMVKTSIENWFLNYDTKDELLSKGWVDEKLALREIKKAHNSK